jgi:hypothetical protein
MKRSSPDRSAFEFYSTADAVGQENIGRLDAEVLAWINQRFRDEE